MKFKLFSSFFIGVLLTSCNGHTAKELTGDIPIISISCEKDQVLNLSEFAESIEIIPLETRDDNLIGWIHRIISTVDRYYLSSAVSYDTQKLFVFDKSGKFIRKIGKEGEGPEEYIGMSDFTLVGDSVLKITENYNLASYDTEGNFIHKRKQRDCPREIFSFKGKVYGLSGNPQRYGNRLLFQLDENDSHRTDFFEVPSKVASVCNYYACTAMFTADSESIYFSYSYGNTIYKLDDKTLSYSPFYQVDLGKENVSWKVFDKGEDSRSWDEELERLDSYWAIDEYLNLDDYFIVNSADETFHSCFSIYSKKTGKVLSGQRIKDDMFFKGNQIKLKPRYTPHYCDGGNYLLWSIKPETLINGYHAYREALGETKWTQFCQKYPRLIEVCEQLDEESNPVLLKIKIKEF